MIPIRCVAIAILVIGAASFALAQVEPGPETTERPAKRGRGGGGRPGRGPSATAGGAEAPTPPAMPAPTAAVFGAGPTAMAGAAAATSPTTPAAGAERPEIDIARAAETLKQDPVDFIYLSQEYVFNLLVVSAMIGMPGVQFDVNRLPPIRDMEAEQSGMGTTGMGTSSSGSFRSTGEGDEPTNVGSGYRSRPVSRTDEFAGERQSGYLSRSVDSRGRLTAGTGTARSIRSVRPTRSTPLAPPSTVDRATQMFSAITIRGNDDLARLQELVKNMPSWGRVGRFPLTTTEKQKIDKAIAAVYATAFVMSFTAPRQQFGSAYGYGSEFEGEEGGMRMPMAPMAPAMPPPMAAGMETVPVAGSEGMPMTLGTPGYGYGMPALGQLPTVDPQSLAEWYYHYQQAIAWERYVAEEILRLKPGEPTDQYKLDVTLQPQDIYTPPPTPQVMNAPTLMIHFDNRETMMSERLGMVKPSAMLPALTQIKRGMETLAEGLAREDSQKSREFLARLDSRKELRWRYRDWLSDQTSEIRRMAEDYSERVKGDRFEIGGVEYLVSQKPLMYPPKGSRNIVTDRLTPYDLLEKDGSLKKAIIEKSEDETP